MENTRLAKMSIALGVGKSARTYIYMYKIDIVKTNPCYLFKTPTFIYLNKIRFLPQEMHPKIRSCPIISDMFMYNLYTIDN